MGTIGFIGTGNMGSIMAKAAAASGKHELLLSNRTEAKAAALAEELGGRMVSNIEAASTDIVFIGVKPQQAEEVFGEIESILKIFRPVVVSMMASITIERLRELSDGLPVIRIMPNTPALVGEGITLYSKSCDVPDDKLDTVLEILSGTGLVCPIEERLMDAASAVTGSGPAFACMFVSALADGAVRMGVPRKAAIEYAAQMIVGTGKLILESGKHPEQLKDEVCSPKGSTIEGIAALEDGAFRAALIEAVTRTCERNGNMVK